MNEQGREQFERERQFLNDLVMKYSSKTTKRFFSLDTQAYESGALDKKTKEMLGMVASLVLHCDDCIKYHLIQCHNLGVSDKEIEEVIAIGLVVGGSITIPHIR
ncbi:MAG: carboxymuconolactone decarboxylase family protein, partial [Candidatus Marinimicrobia bacterium]|nr:carboxymuconolactone decarboxylase family protein [Candidatus Neomarinimicrobiota bacterium]